ncbi:alginate lyase family protein [soil metagenome]
MAFLNYTFWIVLCLFGCPANGLPRQLPPNEAVRKEVLATLQQQIIRQANWAMKQAPVTITAYSSPRSAGGKHDFFSEGDYWWPDPANPGGPYIQRDGLTNPDNFVAHRLAMIRLSQVIGALASAFQLTGDLQYVRHAFKHLNAWFINPDTRMNPALPYAQAISGKVAGRSIGIIDTIQLMEVAQGLRSMENAKGVNRQDITAIKQWFADYIDWLMTHPYGKEEMAAKNNHGTCWVMQVAAFARLTGNQTVLDFCSSRYKTVLLPNQLAADGSFPLEKSRTKPYGYSLFNLDAMTTICQILSDSTDNLWTFATADGRTIRQAIEYMHPYVADKARWPLRPDVMYWNDWPVAQPFLVFGASAFNQSDWLATWKTLNHDPQVEEVIRNLPVRHPLIWLN